jgi:hypothetical protein
MTLLTHPLASHRIKLFRFVHPSAGMRDGGGDGLLRGLLLRQLPATVQRNDKSRLSELPQEQSVDDADFDELDWDEVRTPRCTEPSSSAAEWLFASFLLCMAVAAFPVIGMRWTIEQAPLSGSVLEGMLLLALPVLLPLPFLFGACVASLCSGRASRCIEAWGSFCLGVATGLAALCALCF